MSWCIKRFRAWPVYCQTNDFPELSFDIHGRVQWRKFAIDETRSVQSITNFTLEESTNIFIMQLNIALKGFGTSSRIHSNSFSFHPVNCGGHWTDHNDQRSIRRLYYGQFQMNTCSYGSWSFSCMITGIHYHFRLVINASLNDRIYLSIVSMTKWLHRPCTILVVGQL